MNIQIFRLLKENVLCSTKSLTFNRNNIFSLVSNAELNNGTVQMVNLLDPVQTELPVLTIEELNDLMLGPYGTKCSHGYISSYHEEDVIAILQAGGQYQNPDTYHQRASQVRILCFQFYTRLGCFGVTAMLS